MSQIMLRKEKNAMTEDDLLKRLSRVENRFVNYNRVFPDIGYERMIRERENLLELLSQRYQGEQWME